MPASAIYTLVAGSLAWPPTNSYWLPIASLAGDKPTLILLFTVTGLLGAAYSSHTDVESMDYAAGGALAYVAGMTAVELLLDPATTAYLLTYAAVLISMYVGFAAETLAEHRFKQIPGARKNNDR